MGPIHLLSLLVVLAIQGNGVPLDTETSTSILPEPRIIGGLPAVANQFPYQISLQVYSQHICGGSIIDERHVLSAGHCVIDREGYVYPSSYVRILAGALQLSTTGQYYPVTNIFTHPQFDISSPQSGYDISVLRISGKFATSSAISPIALRAVATPTSNASGCVVSGWGATVLGGAGSEQLMYVDVSIVAPATCALNYNLASGVVCAGDFANGGKDSCQGDSGGPLACNNTLTGIVSYGYQCAYPKYPGVYTDVYYYSGWIDSQVRRSSSSHPVFNLMLLTILMLLSKSL